MPYVETIASLPIDQLVELGERVLAVVGQADPLTPISQGDLARLKEARELTPQDAVLAKRVADWVEANQAALFVSYPGPLPPFDHLRDFWSNFYEGPRNGIPALPLAFKVKPTRFLDFRLNFPFGVPACALTPQSRYIRYFSALGFDLITYKTVRDRPWNPHPFPQWAFVPGADAPITEAQLNSNDQIAAPVLATLDPAAVADVGKISLTNSFGVPSLPMDEWKRDVAVSKQVLSTGQILIVSVMGSGDDPETKALGDDELVRQFATTAWNAHDAGADIVEVNLSCPNTGGEVICRHPELSARVVKAVHESLKDTNTPILIKISYLNNELLTSLIQKCREFIRGVVAINTVSAPTRAEDDTAFFQSRPGGTDIAGLSGTAIRELGLTTVRRLADLRDKQGAKPSDWVIVGVGGVTTPDDFKAYLDAGADAVQSCSGAWANPLLAVQTREQFGRPTSKGVIRAVLDGAASAGAVAFHKPAREAMDDSRTDMVA